MPGWGLGPAVPGVRLSHLTTLSVKVTFIACGRSTPVSWCWDNLTPGSCANRAAWPCKGWPGLSRKGAGRGSGDLGFSTTEATLHAEPPCVDCFSSWDQFTSVRI